MRKLIIKVITVIKENSGHQNLQHLPSPSFFSFHTGEQMPIVTFPSISMTYLLSNQHDHTKLNNNNYKPQYLNYNSLKRYILNSFMASTVNKFLIITTVMKGLLYMVP